MLEKQILDGVLRQVKHTPFAVTFWDKTTERYGAGEPQFTLIIRDSHLIPLLQSDISMAFGEAYMSGAIDLLGDPGDLVRLALKNHTLARTGWLQRSVIAFGGVAAHLGRRSHASQKQDIARHYDLGNDFFRLWLDDSLTYSCAYFRSQFDTLDDAQRQKMDHTLRKLRLKPGDDFLDIGCGWGGLVIRAALQYGAQAVGITLSDEQQSAASAIVSQRGMEQRASIVLKHYQDLAKQGMQFDKIASIGMIEHVGKAHLAEFCQAVAMLLKPNGLALLHMITSPQEGPLNGWSEKYIFPGAYIPTLPEMIEHLRTRGFHIHDVENLRPHYQKTLDHWSERFEKSVDPIRRMFDDQFVRMWRLYLRGTSANFAEGTLEVHQILVSRGKGDGLPLTRADVYD